MITLPLFPLSRPLFPGAILELQIFEVRYLNMIRRCIANESQFGVVWLLEGSEVRQPGVQETLADIGTTARITEWHEPMPALLLIRCEGVSRFRLLATRQEEHGLWVGDGSLLAPASENAIPAQQQAAADRLALLLEDISKRQGSKHLPVATPWQLDNCGWVADRWAELLPMAGEERQRLLAMNNPASRLTALYPLLKQHGLV